MGLSRNTENENGGTQRRRQTCQRAWAWTSQNSILESKFYPNEGIDFSRESDRYYFSFAAVFYSSLMKFEFTMFKMFLRSPR